MSILRSALENGRNRAVGSSHGATGAAPVFKRGGSSRTQRCRLLACSPARYAAAAFARKGRSGAGLCANRAAGRASLSGGGALAENPPSTANKSLKFVPALRASTGRS